MGIFNLKKKKEQFVITPQVELYAQCIEWDTLLTDNYEETSVAGMRQKMAIRYKELKGEVYNDYDFQFLQNKVNEITKDILVPYIDYKIVFDKYLK